MFTAVFALTGPFLQFYTMYLAEAGLSGGEIGYAMGSVSAAKILSAVIISFFADKSRKPNMFLFFAGLWAAVTLFMTYFFALRGNMLILTTFLFAAAWSLCTPLAEGFAMRACRLQPDLSYGRTRLFGSASFIISGLVAAEMISRFGLLGSYLPYLIFAALCAAFSAFILPDFYKFERASIVSSGGTGVRPLLKDPLFMAIMIGAGVAHAGHAALIQFAPIEWKKIGYSEQAVSLFMGAGVLAEIILFWFDKRLYTVLTPSNLFLLAGGAAFIRWCGMATEPQAWVTILALQSLHAFTFGALHLGVMGFIRQRLRGDSHGAAQLLYAAIMWGAAMIPANIAAGHLYDAYGSGVYWAMAALATAGTVILILAPRLFDGGRTIKAPTEGAAPA